MSVAELFKRLLVFFSPTVLKTVQLIEQTAVVKHANVYQVLKPSL